jgi:beta-galactosidase
MPAWPAILFGAAYYHEYQPYERLDTDLDLMKAAGFSVIRVGESVWSTWEPDDGVFDLDWLERILDGAQQRGISVVIGTPSYAVPPWLRRKYPETTAESSTGVPIPYGHRQNADFSHPTFRRLVERVVRQIVPRYAAHPAVIGWQVDNEPGMELLHNAGAFEGFVEDLRARYGDVATLNDRWGLTYWSHRIARWEELWPPDGNTDPPYALAWRRYQARLTTDFIEWQAAIVRELARGDQFVMTCLSLGRPALDPVAINRELDIAVVNIYYPPQEALALPASQTLPAGGRPEWMPSAGTWSLFWQADRAFGLRQEPFLVTETNAVTIGEHSANFPAYDGQLRQAAWAFVARGARMVEYWHWHTLHYGNETYWGGVLGHSLEPGRGYTEIARIGADFAAAGDAVVDLRPDAPVGLLVSPESGWALQFQPPLVVPGTRAPDPSSYERVVSAFYRGLFEAGVGVGVIQPAQLEPDAQALVERWPVLLVPALYVAGDDLLRQLVAYAEAGGHLVVTFRTGCSDEEGRIRAEVLPGPLREAVGAQYLEWSGLLEPVALRAEEKVGLAVGGGHATAWADALVPATASVLARYVHPHFARWAAITTNRHGRGRVTYVGTLPDVTLARALADWIADESLAADPWRVSGGSITSSGARAGDGRRLHFLANWSWEPGSMAIPAAADDLLSGERLEAGSTLALGPWDVRVLAEGLAPRATAG